LEHCGAGPPDELLDELPLLELPELELPLELEPPPVNAPPLELLGAGNGVTRLGVVIVVVFEDVSSLSVDERYE
jgi:hypothetical protein